MYGICMVYVWYMYGICMGYVWDIINFIIGPYPVISLFAQVGMHCVDKDGLHGTSVYACKEHSSVARPWHFEMCRVNPVLFCWWQRLHKRFVGQIPVIVS